eukprot:TRINITY_DN22600_c0_g1_i1.p1 TRINITY_DN22600_c0_g1~~TRINITY_DN22600_c0_g1_i1.p1  ORF type:complete len:344 (+),score=162.99 TRINITY_DN22600_c0_g1_i1:81-1112(+)
MPPKDRPQEDEESEESEEQTPLEFVQSLPDGVRQNILALQGIQEKYQETFLEYIKEIAAVDTKYDQIYAPLYAARKEIVTGAREPTAEEVQKGEEAKEATSKVEEIPEAGAAPEGSEEAKGIPHFWAIAMSNHDTIQEMIQPYDKDALNYCTDVRCTSKADPHQGFEIEFDFAENPYFTNTTLTKECVTTLDEEDGEDMLSKLVGCTINWKEGQNLTVELKKKKQRSKQGKGTRTVTKEEKRPSFFDFFSPVELPDDDDDEELDDEIAEKAEEDYEQCRAFKYALVPRAVDYYTGEAIPTLDIAGFGDGDDDDDDDDEEEEGEEGSKPKSGGKKGGDQECKQQ